MNKGVLVVLMAGVGIGMALSKAWSRKLPSAVPAAPRGTAVVGHQLADRLRGYLEVERN